MASAWFRSSDARRSFSIVALSPAAAAFLWMVASVCCEAARISVPGRGYAVPTARLNRPGVCVAAVCLCFAEQSFVRPRLVLHYRSRRALREPRGPFALATKARATSENGARDSRPPGLPGRGERLATLTSVNRPTTPNTASAAADAGDCAQDHPTSIGTGPRRVGGARVRNRRRSRSGESAGAELR